MRLKLRLKKRNGLKKLKFRRLKERLLLNQLKPQRNVLLMLDSKLLNSNKLSLEENTLRERELSN